MTGSVQSGGGQLPAGGPSPARGSSPPRSSSPSGGPSQVKNKVTQIARESSLTHGTAQGDKLDTRTVKPLDDGGKPAQSFENIGDTTAFDLARMQPPAAFPRASPSLATATLTGLPQIAPAVTPEIDMSKTRELAGRFGWKTANLMHLQAICDANPVLQASVPSFAGIEHRQVLAHIMKHYPSFEKDWKEFVSTFKGSNSLEKCGPVLERIQNGIRKAFAEHPFESEHIAAFSRTNTPLMVRSTGREDDPGTDEKGSDAVSNPGGNLSLSNVAPTSKAINKAVGEVVASYFSLKSLSQRNEIKDDITADPFMPVLLQMMVGEVPGGAVPVSGVMYTREPDLLTPGVVQIDAAPGHAEGVVTGSNSSDLFYVHGNSVHQLSQEKLSRLVPREEGGLTTAKNTKELALNPCLTDQQAKQLAAIGTAIETGYGNRPMDVEWSFDPKAKRFYVFQARTFKPTTPTEATHIVPDKIKELKDVHPVSVVVAAAGVTAMPLDKSNTLVAESAKTAMEYCAKNPHIKAVILRDFIRKNSHEAGYFRALGITIINPKPSEYGKLAEAIKSQTLLVDVGEGIVGIMPKGQKSEDFIAPGLRRHLAPKMESSPLPLTEKRTKPFFAALQHFSEGADPAALRQAVEDAPGRNLMDKYLNAYEAATNDHDRAYLLSKILQITQKSLEGVPAEQAQRFFSKIVANAMDVWLTTTKGELEKKFAMNWLRAGLIQDKESHVIGSDTLYSILGEKAERKIVNAATEASEHQDVFLRSSKFIIGAESRKNWITFCKSLTPDQEQELAKIFVQLGPRVVELWMNSVFLNAYSETNGDPTECLKVLTSKMNDPQVAQALKMAQKAKEVVTRLKANVSELEDPATYDKVKALLDQELIPIAKECADVMRKGAESELSSALASQAFNAIVGTYDDCIKALTGSPMYNEQKQLKATRFAELLKGYLEIAKESMTPDVLRDAALDMQAGRLISYLDKTLDEVTDRVAQKKSGIWYLSPSEYLDKIFSPSKGFSVQLVSLGSNFGSQERVLEIPSLEDLFTIIHQSLLTTSQVVASRGGVSLDQLPVQMQDIANSLMGLNLHTRGVMISLGDHPTVQSIDYNYPNVRVTFNCPLNNHSATFSLEGKMDQRGELQALTLEGIFICPQNVSDALRSDTLGIYLLSACQDVKPANEFIPEFDRHHTKFQWDVSQTENFNLTAKVHLQNMIDYLQDTSKGKSTQVETVLYTNPSFEFLKENPQFISTIFQMFANPNQAQTKLLLKLLIELVQRASKNPTQKNLAAFCPEWKYLMQNFQVGINLEPIINGILDSDELWESRITYKQIEFLNAMNPDYWESIMKRELDHPFIQHVSSIFFKEEVMLKIKLRIPMAKKALEQAEELQRKEPLNRENKFLIDELKTFLSLYDNTSKTEKVPVTNRQTGSLKAETERAADATTVPGTSAATTVTAATGQPATSQNLARSQSLEGVLVDLERNFPSKVAPRPAENQDYIDAAKEFLKNSGSVGDYVFRRSSEVGVLGVTMRIGEDEFVNYKYEYDTIEKSWEFTAENGASCLYDNVKGIIDFLDQTSKDIKGKQGNPP